MNGSDERIPDEAIFVEDPTNFDVSVNPKTGVVRHKYSVVETEEMKLENVPFVESLVPIVDVHTSEEVMSPGLQKARTFYDQDED